MISLAVPAGSIGPSFEALMLQAGMPIRWQGYNGCVANPNICNIVQLRPQDSPLYVARGCIDACVTGEDCLKERGLENELIKVAELPITRARQGIVSIALFVRHDSAIKSGLDFRGGELVATECPNITSQYFQEQNIQIDIDVSHGKTEGLVAVGCVDAGVDVVDTGASLKANDLRIIDVVMESSTVLVANPQAWAEPVKRQALENIAQLLLRALNQV